MGYIKNTTEDLYGPVEIRLPFFEEVCQIYRERNQAATKTTGEPGGEGWPVSGTNLKGLTKHRPISASPEDLTREIVKEVDVYDQNA